jgi:hypothetical protein
MAEQEQFSVYVGAMTLGEYLEQGGKEPEDDVPSFISPRWLMSLERRGLLTRTRSRLTEDEAR